MKPDFALNLSHEGAELLHRGVAGWVVLGAVRFDQPDLDKALADLRKAAGEQAPDGLFTKLVIPASELRYATVLAPGPTDEARRLQIEAEIDGLTPYDIDELVYDFVVEGDHALVVLAAREILDQAEGFAVNHGLNPVAFVAMPEPGVFQGEPFLGETRQARSLLPAGARVVADAQPVQLAGKATPTRAGDAGGRAANAPAAKDVGKVPAAKKAPAVRPNEEIKPRSRLGGGSGFPPRAEDEDVRQAGGLARMGDLVRRMGTRLRQERAGDVSASEDRTASSGAKPTAAPVGVSNGTKAGSASSRGAVSSGAGVSAGKAAETPDASSKSGATDARSIESTETGNPADSSNAANAGKAAEPQLAFSSRRKRVSAPSPRLASSNKASRSGQAGPGGRLAMLPGAGRRQRSGKQKQGALDRLAGGARDRTGRIVEGLRSIGARGKALIGGAGRGSGTGPAKASAKSAADSPPSETGKGLAILGGQGSAAKADQPIVPASRPPADQSAKASEAEALTIFGARGHTQRPPPVARKGLMVAGGVFMLLGAVAVWALFFGLGGDDGRDPGLAQVAPEGGIEAPAALREDDPADAAAGVATPEDAAEPVTEDPDALLEELVRDGLLEAEPAEILEGEAPTGIAADTGADAPVTEDAIGPAEPAQPGEAPSLMHEAPTDTTQRLALPAPIERPSLEEVMPVSAPPPPPPGVEFDLGDDGLVQATPEGAMSPRGVMVHAGRPEAVPPPRPEGIAPAPAEQPEAEPEPEPEAAEAPAEAAPVPDDTPRADPALADARPQPRSPRVAAMAEAAAAEAAVEEAETTEAETTEAETTEDAAEPDPGDSSALAAPGGVVLAALRPQQRPTDLVPLTRAAATTAEIDLSDATEEAVARSLVPSARPEGMSERVREALAAARSSPDSGSSARQRVRGSDAPRLPTSASVAEQATESGLNLRRVNLIGVYGTSSDRRALVRLANGRIVRVGVGDALDGGQVSAIGDSELRYTRRGRHEVLRIGGRG